MRPCNCSKESTKDVAEKSKSDPRDKVPPGAEVEEVAVEPKFFPFTSVFAFLVE